MRIRIRPSRRRAGRLVLDLAAMIDCTFLMLIYFILTWAVIRPEGRLSPTIQTREGPAPEPRDLQPQIVDVGSVDGRPRYRVGARECATRDDLAALLAPLDKPSGLYVQVSGDVPVGFAVAAVQAGRDAGFDQVTYVPQR